MDRGCGGLEAGDLSATGSIPAGVPPSPILFTSTGAVADV